MAESISKTTNINKTEETENEINKQKLGNSEHTEKTVTIENIIEIGNTLNSENVVKTANAVKSVDTIGTENTEKTKNTKEREPWVYVKGDVSAVFVTTPTVEVARSIARGLISGSLAACINIVPGIMSIYLWENDIVEEKEYMLMIKTRTSLLNEVIKYVRANHPYKVVEIISLRVDDGDPMYLGWVMRTVTPGTAEDAEEEELPEFRLPPSIPVPKTVATVPKGAKNSIPTETTRTVPTEATRTSPIETSTTVSSDGIKEK